MDIRPIKTDRDYEIALEEIDSLLNAGVEPDTPQGDRLEVLSILVEAYEEENYPIPLPDPIEAINYFLESRGLSNSILERYIGSRARVWEILNRRRSLSLNMIRRLSEGLGIPVDILIQPYGLSDSSIDNSFQVVHVFESEKFWELGDLRKVKEYGQKLTDISETFYWIDIKAQQATLIPIDFNKTKTKFEKVDL